MNLQVLSEKASASGLSVRGGFHIGPDDDVPLLTNGELAQSLVLLGNTGSSIWPSFSTSSEYKDGLDNPLDRWSQRVGDALAMDCGGTAYYPFGGPPYQPFIKWATKAESLQRSKLGLLMHPEYGLWHAYRLAIVLPEELFDQRTRSIQQTNACDSCQDQPCYGTCPVDAFVNNQYHVDQCVQFLASNPQAQCNQTGCMARMSCPEATQHRYVQLHAKFHITQFVKARIATLNQQVGQD